MTDFIQRIRSGFVFPALVAVLLSLGMYAYLGTFSRYSSDDYCLSAFYYKETDFVTNMIERYQHASSRYTNILFIGLVDKVLGWYNPAILPPLMLALLLLGLFLFLDQIQSVARLGWNRWISFHLAALLTYFSLVQTPDLYQTLYWRAGMTSHFAPFVFIPFLGAFLLQQIRLASERTLSVWAYAACFAIPFVIGGLSEPPSTLMITILILAIIAVWWWVKVPSRNTILLLLSCTLAGAMAALIVLALAPANGLRLGETTTNVFRLVWNIFYRTIEFMIVNVRTLLLPVLVSIAIPGLLFYLIYVNQRGPSRKVDQKRLLFLLPIVWMIGYILVAASFAPSVYGQGFPAARARFSGVLLLTCIFMVTGAIIGILMANRATRSSKLMMGVTILFLIVSLYPLRTVSRLASDVPVYRQRAAAWDARDAQIRSLKDEGVRDLRVQFLENEGVQDLGDDSKFRLNRCASMIYGVNSIVAIPMKK